MPSFQELVVLFVIGLLILGPERLPRVATQIGRWAGKARRTANQLRYQLEREIVLADMEEKKKRHESKTEYDKKVEELTKPGDSPCSTETGQSPAEAQGKLDNVPTGDRQAGASSQRDSSDGATVTDKEDRS